MAEADEGCLSLHCGEAFLDLTVPRDEGYIARLLEAARAFWECIRTGREPLLDPQRDLYVPSGADQEAWFRLAADYRQLDEKLAPYAAEAKAIEKKMAAIEQQLLTMMGEFTLAESSGVRISRYLKRGAIDYKAALLFMKPEVSESELEPFRRQGTEQVRLTLRDEDDTRTEVPFEPEALKQAAGMDYWF